MKLIAIPSDISIVAGNFGELITTGPKHRVVMDLEYGSDIWNGGTATIRLWCPPGSPAINAARLGGTPWVISVNGVQRFTGFLRKPEAERYYGGYMWTFPLVDCLIAWDVFLTNKTFPDPPVVSTTYRVTEALASMCATVAGLSGIPMYGFAPTNATLVKDLYEDGIMEINQSSYLAEIERICQALGLRPFCDAAFKEVRLLDVTNGPLGEFTPDADSVISATFARDHASIPASVLASDDSSGKAIAYGKNGEGANYNGGNFALTGINNLTWASTMGIATSSLASIAHKTYDLARGGSTNLSIVVAGPELLGRRIIGLGLNWESGVYFTYAHHTHISATEYKTTYEAWGA